MGFFSPWVPSHATYVAPFSPARLRRGPWDQFNYCAANSEGRVSQTSNTSR